MLLALLAACLLVQLLRRRIESLLATSSNSTTRVSLSAVALDVSTSAFNLSPQRLLRLLPRVGRGHGDTADRRLAVFYDVGALVVSGGILLAQGVLLVAASRAALALLSLLRPPPEITKIAPLVRRAFDAEPRLSPPGGPPSAADSLILRPVIPGLTTPLSLLPTLVVALVLSQVFHEAGHALAAACEQLPLQSINAHLYFLFLPTLSVSLPAAPSALADLRIATAGIWHNLVLALFAFGAADSGGAFSRRTGVALGVWRQLDEGVLLVAVDAASPLAPHLAPGAHITHLDDFELDAASSLSSSTLETWKAHLGAREEGRALAAAADSYANLGWCLPALHFAPTPSREDGTDEGCCPPAARAAGPSGVRVCFNAPATAEARASGAPWRACLDPLPLLPPTPAALRPARCVDSASCAAVGGEGTGAVVCARIALGERVLRIGVQDTAAKGEEAPRTVLYQGSRAAVAQQLTVTDLAPQHTLVPLSLPLVLEALFGGVLNLSLALAFFNALPLARLDGAHILSAFLAAAAASFDELPLVVVVRRPARGETRSPRAGDIDNGLLARLVKSAATLGVVRSAAERRERVEKAARRWTAGVGGLTLVATVAVELVEWHRRTP
ncbi:hypothetical protein JCM3770_007043 [Rhodotorula araucariae]